MRLLNNVLSLKLIYVHYIVFMAAIMNLQLPVRSGSVGISYIELGTSKLWVYALRSRCYLL